MSRIEFDKPTRDALRRSLIRYLRDEMDVEASGLATDLLLDFLAETLGPHFYNQGLLDAQALFRRRFEEICEAVYEIEKPVKP